MEPASDDNRKRNINLTDFSSKGVVEGLITFCSPSSSVSALPTRESDKIIVNQMLSS